MPTEKKPQIGDCALPVVDSTAETPKEILARFVIEQRASEVTRLSKDAFQGWEDFTSADDFFSALESTGMITEIDEYRAKKEETIDEQNTLNRKVNYYILAKLTEGVITGSLGDSEMILNQERTVAFTRKFSRVEDTFVRPDGLIVKNGVITFAFGSLLSPSQEGVDRKIVGMEEYLNRFGSLAARNADIILVTPARSPKPFTVDSETKHITLPVTAHNIKHFARYRRMQS